MERLIESVRKYPCLWKIDSEEYKLNDLKEAAWREVTKECELPDVKEARSIWKKLRDGHRQAIGRKKTITGQAASTKTPWKYETQMEFLLPTMHNRKRSTNIDPVPRRSQDNTRDGDEIESQQNSESPNSVVEPPYGELVPPNKKTTLVSLLEKEHKRREERSVARTELRNQILQGASTSTTQNSAMDTFFKSMQLTTNALPERLQLKVQRQIFNIVMEAKEEHLTTLALTANAAIQPFLLPINRYATTYSPRSASSSSNYSQTYTSPPRQFSPTYTSPPPQSNAQDNQATYNVEQPYTSPPPPQSSSQATYNFQLKSPPPQSSPQDRYSIPQTYSPPPPQSNAQDNQAPYNVEQPYTSPPPPQPNTQDNQATYSIQQTYTPPPPPQSSAVDEEVSNNIRNYIKDFF